ncbi:hypothetical protein KJS94_04750 [Flavihumibacter rivuli]|uniref:hypothetical protein n=1 Tax=Flavihumibacter rivuli TaxID=2838156 RepID=UPI001BDE496A|nr:hypothetical protein [Flavihumibacter rivuli]ULQ57507.1 hypothetical protein KJS94_04750 [Flavihumibacter rivuli]
MIMRFSSCPGKKYLIGINLFFIGLFLLNVKLLRAQKSNLANFYPQYSSSHLSGNPIPKATAIGEPKHDQAINLVRGGNSESAPSLSLDPYTQKLMIYLPLNWQKKEVNCRVLDSNGEVVWYFSEKEAGSKISLDAKTLPSGAYCLQSRCGKNIAVEYFFHQVP